MDANRLKPDGALYRTAQTVPRQAPPRRRWVWGAGVLALLLMGWGWHTLTHHPRLRIETIHLSGLQPGSPTQRLRPEIDAYQGRNILAVDLKTLARRLLAHPWVRSVRVRRRLPRAISVEIEERRPAMLATFGRHRLLVDGEGVVLGDPRPDTAPDALLKVSGQARTEADRQRQLTAAAEFLAVAREVDPTLHRRVTGLDVTGYPSVVVHCDSWERRLLVSRPHLRKNLTHYRLIAETLQHRYDKIEYLDLRWKNRIYCKPVRG